MAETLLEAHQVAAIAHAQGRDRLTDDETRTIDRPCTEALARARTDFAVVQSYPSTAAHWGITRYQALHRLFNGDGPWIPTTLTPAPLGLNPSQHRLVCEQFVEFFCWCS